MTRVFVCQACQFRIRRFAAALAPANCPYCRSNNLVEIFPVATSGSEGEVVEAPPNSSVIAVPTAKPPEAITPREEIVPANDATKPFACTRGAGCTRLHGGECPGGKGC